MEERKKGKKPGSEESGVGGSVEDFKQLLEKLGNFFGKFSLGNSLDSVTFAVDELGWCLGHCFVASR